MSINVGRSLVVDDFTEAARLLGWAFPGDLTSGPALPASHARPRNESAESAAVWWSPGHRTKRSVFPPARAAKLRRSPIDFDEVDSIQILENWEVTLRCDGSARATTRRNTPHL